LLNLVLFLFREAKNQLRDLLIAAGFPEECLVPQVYNFSGPDPKLDLITALIAMGKFKNKFKNLKNNLQTDSFF
jgi:ATP-dependent RNA helicase A